MNKSKKALIIGGSVAVALLLTLMIVSIAVSSSPKTLVLNAAANTIADARKIEALTVANDVANGGSVALSANLDRFAKGDMTVQGKVYTNARNLKYAGELTFSDGKKKVLDAKIIGNQDRIIFDCPELVDGVYGVDIRKLEKNLPGSIFDPDEETRYSLNYDRFDFFMALRNTIKNDRNLQRDVDAMALKYEKLVIEKMLKYAETKKSSETITVGGDKIPCTVVSLEIDEEALANITKDIIDYAMSDDSLEKLLDRIAANVSFDDDPGELVDEFYDILEEMEDEVELIEKDDIDITFDFYITRTGRRIAQIDFEFVTEKEDFETSLVLGKNVAKTTEMSFEAKDVKYGSGVSITYSVKENNSKSYQAEIKLEEEYLRNDISSTRTTRIKIDWNKKDGSFEIRTKDKRDDTYSVKGILNKKGDCYIFTATRLVVEGDSVPAVKSIGLTLTIDRHDPTPNVHGRYTEITKLDERSFKRFLNYIGNGSMDFMNDYFKQTVF